MLTVQMHFTHSNLSCTFLGGGAQGTEGGIELYPYVKEDFCALERITLEMFTSRFSKQLY